MQLLAAQQAGNEKLANFYAERFPPDVRKAYDAWLAQKPFENPSADPHPFVPRLYEPRGTREAADEVQREMQLLVGHRLGARRPAPSVALRGECGALRRIGPERDEQASVVARGRRGHPPLRARAVPRD